MAFEMIDVNSARSALNSCLNTLDSSDIQKINNNLQSSSIWQTKSQKTLCDALNKTELNYFQTLKKDIKHYIEVINMIQEYKDLEKKNNSFQAQNNSLMNNLYKTEVYDVQESNQIVQQGIRKVINKDVANQMTNLQHEMNLNLQKMKSLENQIRCSV